MDHPVSPPKTATGRESTDVVPGILRRYTTLFIVIVLGVVLVGFLRGVQEPPGVQRRSATEPVSSPDAIPPAVTYRELPSARLRPEDGVTSTLASLRFDRPGLFDKVVRTEEMKQEALADRARTRAYDTAPPTIPHPIEQQTAASCLVCHGEGIKVGDRVATRISHPHYTNCTQCHVEMSRPELESFAGTMATNDFLGAYRSGPGLRASPGAPPSIPHPTWMRQDCLSCHGLIARPGIRTTHPWLTNCTQCHAESDPLPLVGNDWTAFPWSEAGSGKERP